MPLTVQQHSKSLAQPPLCEQLKVRDIIDDLFVELNGCVCGWIHGEWNQLLLRER